MAKSWAVRNAGWRASRSKRTAAKEKAKKNEEKSIRWEGLPHQTEESLKTPAQVQEGDVGGWGSPTSCW